MTLEERLKIVEKIYNDANEIMMKKNRSYAGESGDTLANFKRNAERMNLTPFQVWNVYFQKHIDSINSAIISNPKYPVDHSESLRGRIIDVINYATILECLLRDYEHLSGRTNKQQSPQGEDCGRN